MKFPALGGHSIEVDCNVIEKSLHFMHFCTIDFEEMTDPRFLSILIFLTLILITKYSDQFWEVHFIVLKPRKERPRKIKVEHWIIFFTRITYRSLLSTGSSRQCNYCSGMNRQNLSFELYQLPFILLDQEMALRGIKKKSGVCVQRETGVG